MRRFHLAALVALAGAISAISATAQETDLFYLHGAPPVEFGASEIRSAMQATGAKCATGDLAQFHQASEATCIVLFSSIPEARAHGLTMANALKKAGSFAGIATAQHHPQLLTRIGYVDLNAFSEYAQRDIAFAQGMKAAGEPKPN